MYIFNYCMRLQSHNSNVNRCSSTHLDESILGDKNHQGGVCALYDIIKGQYTYLKNMRTDTLCHIHLFLKNNTYQKSRLNHSISASTLQEAVKVLGWEVMKLMRPLYLNSPHFWPRRWDRSRIAPHRWPGEPAPVGP